MLACVILYVKHCCVHALICLHFVLTCLLSYLVAFSFVDCTLAINVLSVSEAEIVVVVEIIVLVYNYRCTDHCCWFYGVSRCSLCNSFLFGSSDFIFVTKKEPSDWRMSFKLFYE